MAEHPLRVFTVKMNGLLLTTFLLGLTFVNSMETVRDGMAPEHRFHHEHHHHGHRHHHHNDGHDIIVNYIMKTANETNLKPEDAKTVIKIFEANKPEMKIEDRSNWTEDQWAQDEKEKKLREEKVKSLCFNEIEDHEHLTAFFSAIEADKMKRKVVIHEAVIKKLLESAKKANLSEELVEKFLVELELHKPEGVHWRPHMHRNEVRNNILSYEINWIFIKAACLKSSNRTDRFEYMRFFKTVEAEFLRHPHHRHGPHGHHGHHHHHHHVQHLHHHLQHSGEHSHDDGIMTHHHDHPEPRFSHPVRHNVISDSDAVEHRPRHHPRYNLGPHEGPDDEVNERRPHPHRRHEVSEDSSEEYHPHHRRQHHRDEDRSEESDEVQREHRHRRRHDMDSEEVYKHPRRRHHDDDM